MPAPVVTVIESPCATRTLSLSATVTQALAIPRPVAGLLAGVYLTCSTAARYQILPDGGLPADDTPPTTGYDLLPAGSRVPVPVSVHPPGGTGADLHIIVWAEAATPLLHVAPYSVTR